MKQSGVILAHIVRKVCKVITVTCNWYVQINTGILEKVIAETLGYKSSKALWCSSALHSSAQQAVTATICNTVSDPIALSCFRVNCFLPNMDIAMLTPGK